MQLQKPNRAGFTRKNLSGDLAYISFVPTPLAEIQLSYTDELVKKALAAQSALTRLQDAWDRLAPEKQTALHKILRHREAKFSSDLANGYREIPSPLLHLLGNGSFLQQNKRIPEDEADIKNLEHAMAYGEKRLETLPISRRFLEELHQLALGAPHHEKQSPGWFRRSPNWLGTEHADLKTAAFVPPAGEDMDRAFAALENFLHYDTKLPALLRAGLIHYQFETIHPFLDGNGRLGRLLNQLVLEQYALVKGPVLQFSDVLQPQVMQYYMAIRNVQTEGCYEKWLEFYLKVACTAAESTLETVQDPEL